jgi:hypothetical protein
MYLYAPKTIVETILLLASYSLMIDEKLLML